MPNIYSDFQVQREVRGTVSQTRSHSVDLGAYMPALQFQICAFSGYGADRMHGVLIYNPRVFKVKFSNLHCIEAKELRTSYKC